MERQRFAPPAPPPENHDEAIARLPSLLGGSAADRLERAQSYLRNAEAFTQAYHLQGAAGTSVCRVISSASDELLRGLWEEVRTEGFIPDRVALVALGSYGRNELAPHSDLDLLLLRGKNDDDKVRPFAAKFSTLLWDLKRSVGWSVRTTSECVRTADEDHTIRTALLDARLVIGDAALFEEMKEGSLRELFRNRVDTFISDKLQELQIRRQKFGDSIFLLEPEVKKGEGGLRDLEAALWIAQARFRIRGLAELLKRSILSPAQASSLRAAQDFLFRIRHHLHYRRGRKEDRLTFDLQEEVARLMGYGESAASLPVEQFMRDYYLSAKAIHRGADGLMIRCQEKARRRSFWPAPKKGPFKVFDGRLTLGEGPESLRERPERVLQLFRMAEIEDLPLDAWTRDQVEGSLSALAAAAASPEVTEELKSLFLSSRSGRFLSEMHALGALGAVIPEFGRITSLHQHDLYHVYTVDVHTLFAMRRLYSLRAGELAQEQPELTRRIREMIDPLPLFLGMLLHDAGKGMGGHHSERGMALAESLGKRLGLTAHQREVTEFLVHRHLNMSHVAQRRDLSDPDLISAFAREVGTPEKLTCLYLLTYADINSTGPRLWTQWKAQLLHTLFHKTLRFLESGSAEGSTQAEERTGPLMKVWTRRFGAKAAETLQSQLPARYFLTSRPERAGLHAQLIFRARRIGFASAVRYRPDEGYTELSLSARDQPGLLASIAGILSAHRIDILRAHINSTSDGWAIDVFDVRGANGPRVEHARWRAARKDLIAVLAGDVTAGQVLSRRKPTTLFARHLPRVPSRVTVDNSASADFTVVDIQARDRTGLLHTVADAIRELGSEIAFATVATEAHKAIDSFYITRAGAKLGVSDAATFAEQVQARLEAADDSR